jgi:hypothetical protein
MSFLLRTVDLTADGREIARERVIDGDTLTIGRASENTLHLPDLAVEQHHATVTPATGGQLRIEANGKLGFGLDGRNTTSATIDPREGAELAFGSYRLVLAREGDGPVVVTVRQKAEQEGGIDAAKGFTLASVLPGKRGMAWLAFAAIILAFLAVPIWSHLHRPQESAAALQSDRRDLVEWDKSWESGKLSLAHHGLEGKCEACHVQPFVAVRDDSCLACHTDIGDHAAKARLDRGRAAATGGDALLWDVAHFFHKPGPGACTDCHTEHEGAGRMEPPSQQFCADCHSSLDKRLTDTKLGDAGDFGTLHPQFKAAVFTRPGETTPERISLAAHPTEFNGLRFPHRMHLDPRGGVARMAIDLGAGKGYGSALDCGNCHRPNKDRSSFAPVDMERDCEACHSLVYDKVGNTFRSLRHGDVDAMRADLAAMDRSARRPIVTGRRRPGEFAQGGIYYQNFGAPVRNYIGVTRALSRDGVCGECHLPTMRNGRADVMPVNLQTRYFAHGAFDHEAHDQEKCTTCHKAPASDASSDLLLPGIATCRTCHMGEDASSAEVPSSCAMCHSYHPRGPRPANHPALPGREVALATRPGD